MALKPSEDKPAVQKEETPKPNPMAKLFSTLAQTGGGGGNQTEKPKPPRVTSPVASIDSTGNQSTPKNVEAKKSPLALLMGGGESNNKQ
jgi:hypothetical protein